MPRETAEDTRTIRTSKNIHIEVSIAIVEVMLCII
jgi:hypothetical protein